MHIRPIKNLGQSFLTYEPAADQLVAALRLTREDEVIEIGPGKGVLTVRLLRLARSVTAVEIDPRLVGHLEQTLGQASNLRVVLQDALEFDFSGFRDAKVVGNLPYNVASQVLFRLLANLPSWRFGVFTLQREFALRLLASPGTREYGAVTVQFALDTECRRLFNLPPECFKPSPDVTSTAISLRRRHEPLAAVIDRRQFVRVVKASFAQRRKTLGNNLRAAFGVDRAALAQVEQASGIELRRRAETLTVEEFARLSRELSLT